MPASRLKPVPGVGSINIIDGSFEVRADKSYRASNVLLAISRQGTPHKLGVAGEERNKVVYRLVDPQQYQGRESAGGRRW